MIKKFLNSIKVYDCGLTKVRIGNKHDGGYVALKEVCEKTKAIYSFGVGDDIGFEMDFTERFGDVPVELYDPTVDSILDMPCNFKFHREDAKNKSTGFVQESLLKMDVEWDEWSIIEDFNMRELAKFSQILIELHVVPVQGMDGHSYTPYFKGFHKSIEDKLNRRLFASYFEVLEKLKEFFYIFHIHANNSLPKVNVEGIEFPPLIELSLVRKDLVKDVRETDSTFPIEGLDFPNKTDRPDISNVYPFGG